MPQGPESEDRARKCDYDKEFPPLSTISPFCPTPKNEKKKVKHNDNDHDKDNHYNDKDSYKNSDMNVNTGNVQLLHPVIIMITKSCRTITKLK